MDSPAELRGSQTAPGNSGATRATAGQNGSAASAQGVGVRAEAGSNGRMDEMDRVDEIDRVLPAMRGLRSRARVTNLSRAAQLERSLEVAAESGLDEAGRAQAAAVAHQLIGSAGTFGFAEASRRATELKEFFALGQIGEEDVRMARSRLAALRDDLQNDDGEIEF